VKVTDGSGAVFVEFLGNARLIGGAVLAQRASILEET
jgi:hypothetical protein